MKIKSAIALTIVILLLVNTASAYANGHRGGDHHNNNKHFISQNGNQNSDPVTPGPSMSPSVSPVPDTDGDCKEHTKNHGDYVSCIAHKHLGGKKTSEAAHSDKGKKSCGKDHMSPTPSPVPSVSPEPTATPTPEVSPTATPTPTVEPSVSPEPTTEPSITPEVSPTETPIPTPTQEEVNMGAQSLIQQIKDLLEQLKNLLQ